LPTTFPLRNVGVICQISVMFQCICENVFCNDDCIGLQAVEASMHLNGYKSKSLLKVVDDICAKQCTIIQGLKEFELSAIDIVDQSGKV